jgi:hypothetical protein
MRVAGYSYGWSIAYPHFARQPRSLARDSELLALVVAEIHPGNLGALPPSPVVIAFKGLETGLITNHELSGCIEWSLA